jgi:hypothetical protein
VTTRLQPSCNRLTCQVKWHLPSDAQAALTCTPSAPLSDALVNAAPTPLPPGWSEARGQQGFFASPTGHIFSAAQLVVRAYWATMDYYFGAPALSDHKKFFRHALRSRSEHP